MLKKTIVLAIILFLDSACSQSKDERAREVVEHYCDMHFRKYIPVGFKKLEPAFQGYSETPVFADSQRDKFKFQHQKDSLKQSENIKDSVYTSKISLLDKKIDSLDKVVAVQTKTFKGPQTGWTLYHTFTYKNTAKATIKTNVIFTLDMNFTQVIKTLAD